ncbi:huntingtin-interacting protein 1-like isoform X3 [Scleropages formosus]|uniref:huntingtin-interacting protein 1-like isoform X3 n=1 Tax=Scleropages formosus TaxID=113540 RepID=UPI0010FAC80E|nr:huntingtin-interacting protein 1-like isoform X3 [Scleropages formosus]
MNAELEREHRAISSVRRELNDGVARVSAALNEIDFSRLEAVSINKAINTQEVAVKEKHARTCILGTHHERGAHTFWAAVNRLPLSSNAVLCWKFCHVFHKLLRDGHPNVIKDSLRNKADLNDMSRMWGHMSEGYGKLCSLYLKLLITKMDFHVKNPRFPGNLQMSDRQLDEAGENDVNNFFQITVEMFDYLECELNLFLGVFSSLDMSRSVSVTAAGQCRLAPLLQVILDCSHLYDYTVKLLFKLHSCLPADTLEGHRDRFQEQFKKLKNLFYRSSNLQYFKRLIQIPQLPENAPNFLRASALSEHISPVVVVPPEPASPESERQLETEELVDTDVPVQPRVAETKFDDVFGATAASDPFNFSRQNGMRRDNKEQLVEQLTAELRSLKEELTTFRGESSRLCRSLQGRVSELEAELAEQSHLKRQALGESEFLRAELEDLRRAREDTEKEQRSLTEFERKAQANEQRYTKLKEKYTELVQGHAELLRKNAEVTRQVSVARAAQEEVELVRREMREKVKAAREEAKQRDKEQGEQQQVLQRELMAVRKELESLREGVASSQQSSEEVTSRFIALEAERAELARAAERREREVAAPGLEPQRARGGPAGERESGTRAAESLQNRLGRKESNERALESQLAAMRRTALQGALKEAERIIRDSLVQTENPAHAGCTGTAALAEGVKECGAEALVFLRRFSDPDAPGTADSSGLKVAMETIMTAAEKLRPRGLELQQGELGDLVEQEMAATSVTVETAAARIEEMLSASRAVDTGMKMEVNERILSSCTGLMQAVRELILSSKDLQRDILECGRGAATAKEFYAKNSRWTEGLISASKAVGWGAAVMVDAAEEALRGRGGFERLMVSSREIAAGTAQLVAASKVKADRDSANLARLQRASRGVTQAAAGVVASTKSAKTQIEERDTMDFSSMTLIQVKRQEMDSQVQVLELEAQLQRERERLGELRKKHYELAGVAEGWEEGEGTG